MNHQEQSMNQASHQVSQPDFKYSVLENWMSEHQFITSGLISQEIKSWLVNARDRNRNSMDNDILQTLSEPYPPPMITPPSSSSLFRSPLSTSFFRSPLSELEPCEEIPVKSVSGRKSLSMDHEVDKENGVSNLDASNFCTPNRCVSDLSAPNFSQKSDNDNQKYCFKTPARIKRKHPIIPNAPRKRPYIEADPIHLTDSLVRNFFHENWFDDIDD